MSYAIIRNTNYKTKNLAQIYRHNERKNTNYSNKEFNIEYKYKHKIKTLEKENSHLHKIINKFYETVDKFIVWICDKFGFGESKELVNKFQEETRTFIDPVKELDFEEKQKELEWDLEQ